MSDNGKLRALIVEHERATPGGLVYEWLEAHDADVEELRIDIDDRHVDPADYDLLIPLGSEFAAFDDHIPWIPREKELLQEAVEADVSVLGICFGGQLLARALGGKSFRAGESEIGWLPVRTRDPELVPAGPWFQWHFDTFTAPPGATVLADTDVGPQAYVVGRNMGLQFHPEVTPQIMDSWVHTYRHELDAEGVDPDALLEQTRRQAAVNRRTSWQLLEAFLDRVARLGKA
ncbi:MAG TPA: type 1 glutamine amidotransferase [Gaiellaceae bacterium]|nr:type 1 glutamine amidotransferase [Gaiellaceae bacterium]